MLRETLFKISTQIVFMFLNNSISLDRKSPYAAKIPKAIQLMEEVRRDCVV